MVIEMPLMCLYAISYLQYISHVILLAASSKRATSRSISLFIDTHYYNFLYITVFHLSVTGQCQWRHQFQPTIKNQKVKNGKRVARCLAALNRFTIRLTSNVSKALQTSVYGRLRLWICQLSHLTAFFSFPTNITFYACPVVQWHAKYWKYWTKFTIGWKHEPRHVKYDVTPFAPCLVDKADSIGVGGVY